MDTSIRHMTARCGCLMLSTLIASLWFALGCGAVASFSTSTTDSGTTTSSGDTTTTKVTFTFPTTSSSASLSKAVHTGKATSTSTSAALSTNVRALSGARCTATDGTSILSVGVTDAAGTCTITHSTSVTGTIYVEAENNGKKLPVLASAGTTTTGDTLRYAAVASLLAENRVASFSELKTTLGATLRDRIDATEKLFDETDFTAGTVDGAVGNFLGVFIGLFASDFTCDLNCLIDFANGEGDPTVLEQLEPLTEAILPDFDFRPAEYLDDFIVLGRCKDLLYDSVNRGIDLGDAEQMGAWFDLMGGVAVGQFIDTQQFANYFDDDLDYNPFYDVIHTQFADATCDADPATCRDRMLGRKDMYLDSFDDIKSKWTAGTWDNDNWDGWVDMTYNADLSAIGADVLDDYGEFAMSLWTEHTDIHHDSFNDYQDYFVDLLHAAEGGGQNFDALLATVNYDTLGDACNDSGCEGVDLYQHYGEAVYDQFVLAHTEASPSPSPSPTPVSSLTPSPSPADGGSDANTSTLYIAFDKPLNEATIPGAITAADVSAPGAEPPFIDFSVSYSSDDRAVPPTYQLSFTPTTNWITGTLRFTISTALRAADGSALNAAYSYAVTLTDGGGRGGEEPPPPSGDLDAPAILSVTVGSGTPPTTLSFNSRTGGIDPDAPANVLTVTFNEAVTEMSLLTAITLQNVSVTPSTSVSVTMTATDVTRTAWRIEPVSSLDASTNYDLVIGAVRDDTGNARMSSDTYGFTTAAF